MTITEIDGLDRQRTEQKRAMGLQRLYATPRMATASYGRTTETRASPKPADPKVKLKIDQRKADGLCFKCGKPGRISRNCPDQKKIQVQSVVTDW
jgi:hypothetical protein